MGTRKPLFSSQIVLFPVSPLCILPQSLVTEAQDAPWVSFQDQQFLLWVPKLEAWRAVLLSLDWSIHKANKPNLLLPASPGMILLCYYVKAGGASGKEPACQYRRQKRCVWWGKIPEGGYGNPLQYSCLKNPMDRGAWWATVHKIAKSQTWLKWPNTHTCEGALPTTCWWRGKTWWWCNKGPVIGFSEKQNQRTHIDIYCVS